MSEAEFLTLNEGDFLVLEEGIEFDEAIQREERVRFYTKTEQEKDAFEKLLPKGASTLAQRQRAQREVNYYSDLYDTFVVPTAEDYVLREPKKTTEVEWIKPVHAAIDYVEADLFTTVNKEAANYYPRMIRSLPRPFGSADGSETIFPLEKPTEFVTKEWETSFRAVPDFRMVTTLVNEDKTIEIRRKPVLNTGDIIPLEGYCLFKRPVEIPNPMPGHPFFENAEPKFLKNPVPLSDLFPDIDAIFTHGIPVTPDPYEEAAPFLKVYDVKLSEVPWSVWKSRFPPVSVENEPRERVDISFPASEEMTISSNIQEIYGSQHFQGMSPREWLMRREDGGSLIVKLLLSESNEFGNVEIIPGIDLPLPGYPETTLEECRLTGISFQDFTTRGILRRSWVITKDKVTGKEIDIINFNCVPMEYVQQERARTGYTGRITWRDDTSMKIKEKQIRLLKKYAPLKQLEEKKEIGTRTPSKEQSELRKQVLAILHDTARDRSDQHRDIKVLLENAIYSNQTYTDQTGLFVVCAHTLEMVGGALLANADLFYDTWGVEEAGFYVCKVCGQRIDSVHYDTGNDFDQNNKLIVSARVMAPTTSETVVSETSLQKIKHLLKKNSTVHHVMFLLLGLLQVEPTVEKMPMYLSMATTAAEGIPETGQGILVRGIIGLVATGILLQTHKPFLIPRRAFGPKPLKMSGFPRDTNDTKGETIFDSLLLVIRKTFESYPTSVSDLYATFVREVIKDSSKMRMLALKIYTKQFLEKQPSLKGMLEEAKTAIPPPKEEPETLPTIVPVPEMSGQIKNYPPCGGSAIIYSPPNLPKIRQAEVPLKSGILATETRIEVRKSESIRVEPVPVPNSEISKMQRLKDSLKGTYLDGKIGDSVQTNLAIASRIADIYKLPVPIRSVDPTQSPADLRDYARGLIFQLINTIKKEPRYVRTLNDTLKSDLMIRCLLAKLDSEKNEVRRVSANERLSYVRLGAKMTDLERETNAALVAIGMGPVLITLEDRDLLARREEEQLALELDEEIGVGVPQEHGLDDGEPAANAAAGNYGDLPGRLAGRDAEVPGFADDPERGI